MILRRYGKNVEAVVPNFDSKALTEIGFRRTRERSMPAKAFEEGYEKLEEHPLEATAEGRVQDEVEQAMLDALEAKLGELEAGLGDGEVLYVESEAGTDYPKARDVRKNVVERGQNLIHFTARVEPPLRIGVYRKRG